METLHKALRRLPGIFAATGVILLTGALLAFPTTVKAAVRDSILYCLTVLIPSLFPFMVLSSLTVLSPAGDALGVPLGPIARWGFRLPGCCAAAVLMGFLGGYPAGARSTALLLEQGKITRRQAGRMMLFCVNPGPAFVVTYLGGSVLGHAQTGWLLFFSVTLSGLLLGLALGLFGGSPPPASPPPSHKPGGALVRSISGASRSVLVMCACIVSFAALSALAHATGLFQAAVRAWSSLGPLTPPDTAAALSFLLEITGGIGDAAQFRSGPALYAFGLAFGGLCVHLQVFAMFPDFPIKKGLFFLFRLLHGLLAAGCCHLLSRLLPVSDLAASVPVSATAVQPLSGTAAGGASLLLLCAAFLLVAGREESPAKPPLKNAKRKTYP